MTPQQALVKAVVDTIRAVSPIRQPYCAAQPNHQPPPASGQYYIAVFPRSWSAGPGVDGDLGLDRYLGVGIGITQRTGVVPEDRMYKAMNEEHGVLTLFQCIDHVMREKRYEIICLAEGFIDKVKWGGQFVEPLKLSSNNMEVRKCGPEHFKAKRKDKRDPDCEDFGLYLIADYNMCRYMKSFETIPDVDGISVMGIEDTFVVQPGSGEPEPPDPPDPETETWDVFIPSARSSNRSGGYGAFSSDSRNVAYLKDALIGQQTLNLWHIQNLDGTVKILDPTSHPTGGASNGDFLWADSANDYFWINGFNLELRSLTGTVLQSWPLPTEDNGRSFAQWRTGPGSNRVKQYILAYNNGSEFDLAFTRAGLAEGLWIEDLPGKPADAIRAHNWYVMDGTGYGGTLASALPGQQSRRWHTNYTGDYLTEIKPGEAVSHDSYNGTQCALFDFPAGNTDLVILELQGNSEVEIGRVTQAQWRQALDVQSYIAGGHTDLRGSGCAFSVRVDQATQTWAVLYWDGSNLTVIDQTITGPDGVTFGPEVLPSISLNNRYFCWQQDGGVKVSTIPN